MVDLTGIYISLPLYILGLLFLGVKTSAAVLIFHVTLVPLIFKYSKSFRRTLIFANFVQWPLNFNYDDPTKVGLHGTRNISVEYDSNVDHCRIKLGIWHILPKSVYERLKGHFENETDRNELHKLLDKELADSKTPIIIYFHGNSNNRATAHRILLYQFLQKMEFHTIAFDYRGYGDSTKVHPTEAGVVEDSLLVYNWLQSLISKGGHKPPVFVWGHSLGTGISSSLLGNLERLSKEKLDKSLPLPNGLILEAPFNNLADEVTHHPLARMVTWLPYFDATFAAPFRLHTEQQFCSDMNLAMISNLPVLILHAKDDYVVPFRVGLKLYRSLLSARQDGGATLKFHAFDKTHQLGHKYICCAPDLNNVVGDFVTHHI